LLDIQGLQILTDPSKEAFVSNTAEEIKFNELRFVDFLAKV
jgi:hypothetical protein